METAKKVTVFGSFVVDLMARTPRLPVPGETVKGTYFKQGAGGKGFNQGIAAHKSGGNVVMVTKLGRDSLAQVAESAMDEVHLSRENLSIMKRLERALHLLWLMRRRARTRSLWCPVLAERLRVRIF